MDKRAIGVFDSGLGGLTAVKQLQKIMPNEDIVYFGDTARVPYGTRADDTILKFAMQDLKFVLEHDVKAVLVACGTVTSVALPTLEKMSNVYISGVVEPAAKAALVATSNKKIAVLGTSATTKSRSFEKAMKAAEPSVDVLSKACPLFVPLVENGYFNKENKIARDVAEEYLKDVEEYGADTLILGCTHYPILKDIISDILKGVNIIDSGAESALVIEEYIRKNDMKNEESRKGICTYYVSDSVDNFRELSEIFLETELKEAVVKVSIDE